jgi:hypothetical protein
VIGQSVEVKAAGDALTVDELRAFLAALDRAQVPGSAVVRGRVAWHGAVKSLAASA